MQHASLRALGHEQIGALCRALDLPDQHEPMIGVFETLAASWAHRATDRPLCTSDITDDSSPFEFSVAYDGAKPELRLLVEALAEPADARTRWNAAWQLNERLEERYGARLERARLVADLFEPTRDEGLFSLWHASAGTSAKPQFKLYFNPEAQGAPFAMDRIREALARLNMSESWRWLADRPFTTDDRTLYFSLDLSSGSLTRTKIYVAHRNATADRVERFMHGAPGHESGDAERLCRVMTGTAGPYTRRPPITCMAFREGTAEPYTTTLHLPIRCYVPDDAVALERISAVLEPESARAHQHAVRAVARRPLDAGTGIQTYVSIRRERGRARVTIYLSPEAYRGAALRAAGDEKAG